MAYHLITNGDYKKLFTLNKDLEITSLKAISIVLCDLGKYDRFSKFAEVLRTALTEIISDFNIDFQAQCLKIGNNTITEEI